MQGNGVLRFLYFESLYISFMDDDKFKFVEDKG